MKLTKGKINALIKLIDAGLCAGAGDADAPGQFCIQQAVSRTIIDDMAYEDSPVVCVNQQVIQLGVHLNDQDWSSEKARAKGLKAFAIAELGSNQVSGEEFVKLFEAECDKVGIRTFNGRPVVDNDKQYIAAANAAVAVLKRMGTEGSKYLDLLEEPKKGKPKHTHTERSYAASLCETTQPNKQATKQ